MRYIVLPMFLLLTACAGLSATGNPGGGNPFEERRGCERCEENF